MMEEFREGRWQLQSIDLNYKALYVKRKTKMDRLHELDKPVELVVLKCNTSHLWREHIEETLLPHRLKLFSFLSGLYAANFRHSGKTVCDLYDNARGRTEDKTAALSHPCFQCADKTHLCPATGCGRGIVCSASSQMCWLSSVCLHEWPDTQSSHYGKHKKEFEEQKWSLPIKNKKFSCNHVQPKYSLLIFVAF